MPGSSRGRVICMAEIGSTRPPSPVICRKVIVSGRVQGVWFRESCRREALRAGVSGYVCNRPDRTVEAVFQGSENAVAELVAWCRIGPERARVTDVRVTVEYLHQASAFEVR